MLHLRFASTDPAMNLALEEALFNSLEEGSAELIIEKI